MVLVEVVMEFVEVVMEFVEVMAWVQMVED